MRISDWSSDVCSSDLAIVVRRWNVDADGIDRARHALERPEQALVLADAVAGRRPQDVIERLLVGVGVEDSAAVSLVGAIGTAVGNEDGLVEVWIVQRVAVVAEQLERRVEARSEEHTSELQSLMRISYA